MDESGKRTLATLFNATHGVVLATTPLTRDFANDIHIMQQEG